MSGWVIFFITICVSLVYAIYEDEKMDSDLWKIEVSLKKNITKRHTRVIIAAIIFGFLIGILFGVMAYDTMIQILAS